VLNSQRDLLLERLDPSQADKLDAFAQMLARLSPEERWLIGEYVERASLSDFLAQNTSSSLLESPANLEKCSLPLTRQRHPR